MWHFSALALIGPPPAPPGLCCIRVVVTCTFHFAERRRFKTDHRHQICLCCFSSPFILLFSQFFSFCFCFISLFSWLDRSWIIHESGLWPTSQGDFYIFVDSVENICSMLMFIQLLCRWFFELEFLFLSSYFHICSDLWTPLQFHIQHVSASQSAPYGGCSVFRPLADWTLTFTYSEHIVHTIVPPLYTFSPAT